MGLTEHLHQHGLPALAAHGPEDTARGLERWYADDQAVLLWRTLGREDEAARVVAEWQPPAPGDDEAPF